MTKKLITTPNMSDSDGFYAKLLALHQDKSVNESAMLNTKLILLLANHIGDGDVLEEALAAANSPTAPVKDR